MLFLTSGVTCSSNIIFLIFMSLQCMLPQIKSISNILDRCCCSECTLSYYKATSFTLGFDVMYLNSITKTTCFDQLKDVSKYINMALQESKKCNLKKYDAQLELPLGWLETQAIDVCTSLRTVLKS